MADRARDFGVGEFVGVVEVGASLSGCAREHAVRDQAVEVEIESDRRVEALVEHHGAGVAAMHPAASGLAPVGVRHGTHPAGACGKSAGPVAGGGGGGSLGRGWIESETELRPWPWRPLR